MKERIEYKLEDREAIIEQKEAEGKRLVLEQNITEGNFLTFAVSEEMLTIEEQNGIFREELKKLKDRVKGLEDNNDRGKLL